MELKSPKRYHSAQSGSYCSPFVPSLSTKRLDGRSPERFPKYYILVIVLLLERGGCELIARWCLCRIR